MLCDYVVETIMRYRVHPGYWRTATRRYLVPFILKRGEKITTESPRYLAHGERASAVARRLGWKIVERRSA